MAGPVAGRTLPGAAHRERAAPGLLVKRRQSSSALVAAALPPAGPGGDRGSAGDRGGASASSGSAGALSGLASMFAVAAMWGSNPVALRFLYVNAGPPHPALLQLLQCGGAALLLAVMLMVVGGSGSGNSSSSSSERERAAAVEMGAWRAPGGAGNSEVGAASGSGSGDESSALLAPAPSGSSPPTTSTGRLARWWSGAEGGGGVELGLWAFVANVATIVGFQHCTATRGAFLFRLSAAFTPLVAAAAGQRVDRGVWAAVAMALTGSLLLAASSGNGVNAEQAAATAAAAATATGDAWWEGGRRLLGEAAVGLGALASGGLSFGDGMLVLAALLWSVQTVRVGVHAARQPPLPLAVAQLAVVAALSFGWLLLLVVAATAAGSSGGGVGAAAASLWPGAGDPVAWAVLLWPAVGPWGLGTWLQFRAQGAAGAVSPTAAMLVLATDPLWTALFSGALGSAAESQLGGGVGTAGAALVLAASLLAGRASAGGGGAEGGARLH